LHLPKKFYELYQGAVTGENSFNPIRVDWWQVPGRDEDWKNREIANLGSVELFNQEYGNQFLSSSTLLLGSNELKKIKSNQIASQVTPQPALPCLLRDQLPSVEL